MIHVCLAVPSPHNAVTSDGGVAPVSRAGSAAVDIISSGLFYIFRLCVFFVFFYILFITFSHPPVWNFVFRPFSTKRGFPHVIIELIGLL